jgi:hypothetical protein
MASEVSMNMRVGWAVGAAGFVLLFLAQMPVSLGAALLYPLIGVMAGLGMAKWLPRAWYGRQFDAGLRAGAIAAGGATAGLLLSVLLSAPRGMAALAARSHLFGLSLTAQIGALRGLGWMGVTLLAILLGSLACAALAGLTAQAFALDKSRHAIQAVDRAREAAQRSNRATAVARPTHRPLTTPGAGMVLGQAGDQRNRATYAPTPNPWGDATASSPPSGQLDLGAAHSRELHEALAAWAGSGAVPPAEPARPTPGAPEDDEAAPDKKPGNWLC